MKICMLAYAHYLNDARIKCYVQTLEDRGHQVDVIALRSEGELSREPSRSGTIFRIMDKYQGHRAGLYVLSYAVFFLKASFLLARRSVRERYNVLHVHNMPNFLVFATIVARMLGARLILDVHDLMPVNYMAKFHVSDRSLPVKLLILEQRLSSMFADHVVCADDNQKDFLAERCGISKKKITVMMNLPNTQLFGPRPGPMRTAGTNRHFQIVYHGTIAHRLGIDLILRAMAKVSQRVPVELWIYGTGDYLQDALALSEQLGLDKNVHFSKSFFPVEKIPEMVSGSDLGIIGNRRNLACDKYMLPVKLLEYVYFNIPVIVPRLAVIQRYFDETMLRYYDPENVDQMADAIEDAYRNPDAQRQFAESASNFYREHNIQTQADRYLELITTGNIHFHSSTKQEAQPNRESKSRSWMA